MKTKTIALVGAPNAGKTSLFNALTGSNQRVANYSGVTIEKKIGEIKTSDETTLNVIDLPGIYTLDVHSLDEKITRDVIFQKRTEDKIDLIILVIDATRLQKGLYLALQLKERSLPFVVALNMMDEAERRGLKLNLDKLSDLLNCPVAPVIAVQEKGLGILLNKTQSLLDKNIEFKKIDSNYHLNIRQSSYVKEHFSRVDQLLKEVIISPLKPDSLTELIDHWILHPFVGPIILASTLILIFQFLFSWSAPFVEAIEWGIQFLSDATSKLLPAGHLKGLVIDGIINGVGGVLVFLPHVVFLFFFILFLEDLGYMGRAAFLLNGLMKKLGLPGKAVIPLLSSHACAIPGIMSARIIDDWRQRIATILVTPLTTCSARLPVYTLLISALVPARKIGGFLDLRGLVLFGLYGLGLSSAFIVAWCLKKYQKNSSPIIFLMELPPYRRPKLKFLLKGIWFNAKIFLRKAGTIILGLSIIIWALVSFPQTESGKVQDSYAAQLGTAITPLFSPQGFDWKITTALIPSFGAREVMISALSMVYSIEEENEELAQGRLQEQVAHDYTPGTLVALIIWFVYAPQCISTFAVMKKETGGWKWPCVMMSYTLVLAYVLSFVAKIATDYFLS